MSSNDKNQGAEGTAYDPPTALAMLEWRIEQDPDAIFIITPDGTERTYAEIGRRVGFLAHALELASVSPGEAVGLYLASDPSWIIAVFACWRCGAVPACCGTITPPEEALRRFALVSVKRVVPAADLPEKVLQTRINSEGELCEPVDEREADWLSPRSQLLTRDSAGAILFTSGTTGEPKAVRRPHSHIADAPRMTAGAYARSASFRPRVAPRHVPPALTFNPFGHGAALGRMVFRLYVGRPLIVIPKFDVEAIEAITRRYPIDTLQLTPAMIYALAFTDKQISFKSLKYVNSGTAPLAVATRDRFESRYGVPVLQAYGSTEGAINALERYEDAIAGRRGPGSVGRIPAGMPYRIVDAKGNDVRPGDEGELLGKMREIRGVPLHPAVDAEGWYHTGDLARIDEQGILYITGRLKEMMIAGGFNIYPREVEEALLKQPQLRDAVVIPLPDERLGEIPVAGLVWDTNVPKTQRDAAWQTIVTQIRQLLEPYKIPRQWFALNELPRNANGKVDRRAAVAAATQELRP